jgi:hypothetical protein
MSNVEPRYTSDEFARRGREIYERQIRSQTHEDDIGRFVAIDIETGIFEIDDDDFGATERLFQSNEDVQIWIEQVGAESAYRIGTSGGTQLRR